MIDEEQFVSYFENLAIRSKAINHTKDGGKSFFYIEEPDDTSQFDDALRNAVTSPTFLLVADNGEFSDNNTENHTQEINGQFYVVAKITDRLNSRQARAFCLPIVVDFLARIKQDARKNEILARKIISFRIDKIPYQKVGPINDKWYGYTVWFSFTCPFGFSVTSGSWRDNNNPAPPVGGAGSLPSSLA